MITITSVWNGFRYGKLCKEIRTKNCVLLCVVVVIPRLWSGRFVHKIQPNTQKHPTFLTVSYHLKTCQLLAIFRTRRKRLGLLPHIWQRANRRDIMTPPPEIWLVPPSGYSSGEISDPMHGVTRACRKPTITNHSLCSLLQKAIKRRL